VNLVGGTVKSTGVAILVILDLVQGLFDFCLGAPATGGSVLAAEGSPLFSNRRGSPSGGTHEWSQAQAAHSEDEWLDQTIRVWRDNETCLTSLPAALE
jgi:hypothetical protein